MCFRAGYPQPSAELVHIGEPTETQIYGELSASGDKTYVQRTIGASADGELTLKDYVCSKDSTQCVWLLKKFGEFMEFCNLGGGGNCVSKS